MKQTIAALAALTFAVSAFADSPAPSTDLVHVNALARFDYQQDYLSGDQVDSNSGFEGKYLMLRLDGTITPGLSYSWRQRLNKMHKDNSFFDATDWLYLDYRYRDFSFSAGKQTVLIGSYEYDRNPANVFQFSVFNGNIACFQLGASAGYHLTGADCLTLQINQSPFFDTSHRNLYAYNLYWNGSHGCWSPLWSANMVEYAPGHWINYLALGNRFDFKPVWLELDVMNRAAAHSGFFTDNSVIANAGVDINEKVTVHAKFSLDRNASGRDADLCVADGTNLKMIGGGVEYYPLRRDNHSLRLHADAYTAWGRNANSGDVMQNHTVLWSVGLTWQMDLFTKK